MFDTDLDLTDTRFRWAAMTMAIDTRYTPEPETAESLIERAAKIEAYLRGKPGDEWVEPA